MEPFRNHGSDPAAGASTWRPGENQSTRLPPGRPAACLPPTGPLRLPILWGEVTPFFTVKATGERALFLKHSLTGWPREGHTANRVVPTAGGVNHGFRPQLHHSALWALSAGFGVHRGGGRSEEAPPNYGATMGGVMGRFKSSPENILPSSSARVGERETSMCDRHVEWLPPT